MKSKKRGGHRLFKALPTWQSRLSCHKCVLCLSLTSPQSSCGDKAPPETTLWSANQKYQTALQACLQHSLPRHRCLTILRDDHYDSLIDPSALSWQLSRLTESVSLRSPLIARDHPRRWHTNREPFRVTLFVSTYISYEEIERRVAVLPVDVRSSPLSTHHTVWPMSFVQ